MIWEFHNGTYFSNINHNLFDIKLSLSKRKSKKWLLILLVNENQKIIKHKIKNVLKNIILPIDDYDSIEIEIKPKNILTNEELLNSINIDGIKEIHYSLNPIPMIVNKISDITENFKNNMITLIETAIKTKDDLINIVYYMTDGNIVFKNCTYDYSKQTYICKINSNLNNGDDILKVFDSFLLDKEPNILTILDENYIDIIKSNMEKNGYKLKGKSFVNMEK